MEKKLISAYRVSLIAASNIGSLGYSWWQWDGTIERNNGNFGTREAVALSSVYATDLLKGSWKLESRFVFLKDR